MVVDKSTVSGTGEQETAPSDNLNAENSKRFVDQAASVKLRPKPQALKCKLSPPKPKVQAPSPE